MTDTYYDFFGELLLQVTGGSGRSTRQFRSMYDHFQVSNPRQDPDVIVEETTDDIELETVLGDPRDHYGWTGERFVVRNGSEYMAVDPGWDHLYVTPGWEPFDAIYPVEFLLRQHAIRSDVALIHASGVQLDGETTIFPAWRGAGKTNSLLSLLREGAGYLADDRLWVGTDGETRGFPLGMNLQPFNIQSFPEIDVRPASLEARVRDSVADYVDEHADSEGSLVEKGVRFLNHRFVKDDSRSFTRVSDLFPRAEFVETSDVDNVVILQAAPESDSVRVEPTSVEEAVTAVSAISFYEWNEQLEEYFGAYDALVESGTMLQTLSELMDAEKRIFRTMLEGTSVYKASIPRESDWRETGTDEELVEAIRSLQQRDAATAAD